MQKISTSLPFTSPLSLSLSIASALTYFSYTFYLPDNKSLEDRYVVIIDFWHPELSADERTALDFVYDTRNKFETGGIAVIEVKNVKFN